MITVRQGRGDDNGKPGGSHLHDAVRSPKRSSATTALRGTACQCVPASTHPTPAPNRMLRGPRDHEPRAAARITCDGLSLERRFQCRRHWVAGANSRGTIVRVTRLGSTRALCAACTTVVTRAIDPCGHCTRPLPNATPESRKHAGTLVATRVGLLNTSFCMEHGS